MKKFILLVSVLTAFAAVSFTYITAFANPMQGNYDNSEDVEMTVNGDVINIVGKGKNNVINWESFNISENEKIQFDDKNYLNIVNDKTVSQISGAIEGGGNVYIINPNGVMFCSNSSVNVGNLSVSTRQISGDDINFFNVGENPFLSEPTDVSGDIINLGKIKAEEICLEGDNVTLTNNIEGKLNVCGKNIGLGFVCENGMGTVNEEQFAPSNKLSDLSDDFVKKNNASFSDFEGNNITPKPYWAVRNVYELQNMKNNLNANYMLVNDIDAATTKNWNNSGGFEPIGITDNQFAGSFNGMGFQLKNLYIDIPEDAIKNPIIGFGGNMINIDIPSINSYSESLNSMAYKDGKLYVTSLGKSTLYIADYAIDNTLLSVKKYDIPTGVINGEYDFSGDEKAFLWTDNMKPLYKSEKQ